MNTLFKSILTGAAIVALPAIASAQACPSYGVSGSPLNYTADTAYVPQSTSVVAGGPLNLSACGSIPGVGYIVENPDFTMQYQDLGMGRMLEIRVNAVCDAVLLVNGADGQWYFNDDANGSDPAIQLTGAISGQYDIWVGTFDVAPCDATLTVETF
jgi:hypothetical protein